MGRGRRTGNTPGSQRGRRENEKAARRDGLGWLARDRLRLGYAFTPGTH